MPHVTIFDPKEHHIRLVGSIKTSEGKLFEFRAILDTGAPRTEFSDQFLAIVGMVKPDQTVAIQSDQQTKKYGKLILPKMTICGHDLHDLSIHVSRYKNHWGIDALIGLDFFKKFRVTIDYQKGQLVTEAY